MPLFFGDLLAATARWKGEERSLYLILLAYQWSGGPLPSEPEEIADMAQYRPENFKKLWMRVSQKFVDDGSGGLVNLRLEEHRRRAATISEKRANAGQKGGSTTQAKAKQLLEQTDKQPESKPQANASILLGHPNQTKPNQTSSLSLTSVVASEIFENGTADKTEPEQRAYAMSQALLERGVSITCTHPVTVRLVEEGFTLQQAINAAGICRQHKPKPQTIPANYFDKVIRGMQPRTAELPVQPSKPRAEPRNPEFEALVQRALRKGFRTPVGTETFERFKTALDAFESTGEGVGKILKTVGGNGA